jgi:hypothetical protein
VCECNDIYVCVCIICIRGLGLCYMYAFVCVDLTFCICVCTIYRRSLGLSACVCMHVCIGEKAIKFVFGVYYEILGICVHYMRVCACAKTNTYTHMYLVCTKKSWVSVCIICVYVRRVYVCVCMCEDEYIHTYVFGVY